ncbi:hypothetical protein [Streptomyces sp. NPDC017993]|uniref:hypothetical protein n=1 Tax=Streptomyces sp. NPDC017993 TaxID=3365027 RepID=UPI0037AB407D
MTNDVKAVTSRSRAVSTGDPESLDQLRGDCARMAPHWKAGRRSTPAPAGASDLHGIKVSAASAALVDGMSEYGD